MSACLLAIVLRGACSAADGKDHGPTPDPRSTDIRVDPAPPPGARLEPWEPTHLHAVDHLAFSRDGRSVVTISTLDDTIRWWDVRSGKQTRKTKVPRGLVSSCWDVLCMDGRYLVYRDRQAHVTIRDLDTGRDRVLSLAPAEDTVYAFLSPDSTRLAIRVGDTVRQKDDLITTRMKPLRIWDVVRDQQLASIKDDVEWFCGFSPNGKLWVSDNGKSITLWNAGSGEKHTVIPRGRMQSIAFSQDSRFLAVVPYPSQKVEVWDVSTGKKQKTVKFPSTVVKLAYSPDDRLLAAACDDRCIHFLNPRTGVLAFTLGKHRGYAEELSFSRDGKLLVSRAAAHFSNEPMEIKVWSIKDKKELATLREPAPPAVRPPQRPKRDE